MKVSVTISGLTRLFGRDLDGILGVARAADEAGIHQIVLPDHLAIGTRTDRYPFGTFPFPPEEPWLEPVTALAVLAGATTRVRLGTGVLIAPLRPALLLAKSAATLDVLSGGRLDLGVGNGWQREEFTDPGGPFIGRTARMEDVLRACRTIWTQEPPVTVELPTVAVRDLWCEPRPRQPGGIPIWFGSAANDTTARRIAELGDGWLPIGASTADELAPGIELLRAAFRDAGRDPAALGVRAGLPAVAPEGTLDLDATLAPVPDLEAVGVTYVSIGLGRFLRSGADVAPFLRDLGAAFA
jgi:probable F420-dependent oxidoreductase